MTRLSRRRFVGAAGGAFLAGLAGCQDTGGGDGGTTTRPPPHTTTEPPGGVTVGASLGVPALTDAHTLTFPATPALDGQQLREVVVTYPEGFSVSADLTARDVSGRVGRSGSGAREMTPNAVEVSADGRTLTVRPGSSITLAATDTVVVEYRGVSAPPRTGDYLVSVAVNGVGDTGALAIADEIRPRESTFEATTEGWTVVGDVQDGSVFPDRVEDGGDPGAYLSAEDDVTGDVWYWVAPRAFRGAKAPYVGGRLSLSLRQSRTVSQFSAPDVVLASDERTLYHDFGDADAHPRTEWTRYDVPLRADAWLQDTETGSIGDVPDDDRLDRSEPATASTFESVLTDLSALHVRGEYVSGADTGDLDRVTMVPGPDEESTTTG